MYRLLKSFLLAAAMAALPVAAWAGDGAVLLWMVQNDDAVSDFGDPSATTVNALRSRPDKYEVNGIRIRVDTDGASTYLNMMEGEEGDYGVGGSLVFWDRDEGEAGPAWADVSGYSSSDLFTIELGHFSEQGWVVMAVGESKTYDALQAFINADPVDVPGYVPWTTSYTVPEPSSGLLLVVGAALLSLRRRARRA